MKKSIYNTVISLREKQHLIYNAFSDKFLVAKCDASDIELRFKSQLEEIGALIKDDINQAEIYREFVNNQDNDKRHFGLIVNPTLDCNFRCWYCYETHLQGSRMEDDVLDSVKELINTRLSDSETKSFRLSFFGGEPLLGFKNVVKPLIELSRRLCDANHINFDVHFTSNGYLINDEVIECLSDINCTFQITLDGGKEFHNKTRFTATKGSSYDKITDNIRKLAEKNFRVCVRINYTKENLESIKNILPDLLVIADEYRKRISIDFQHVWQDKTKNETEEVSEIVTELARQFSENGFISETHLIKEARHHSCYGDKSNNLLVNYNGDVFRCTARDFANHKRHGFIQKDGSVVWNPEILEKYLSSKENQTACMTCRVASLCGSSCRQSLMEFNNTKECIFGLSEEDKDKMVLNHFESRYMNS